VRVVVGAPADIRQHTRRGLRPELAEGLDAQTNCRNRHRVGVLARDQHFDLTAVGRHDGQIGVDHLRSERRSQPGERRHALA
jgi:hypothetical protein